MFTTAKGFYILDDENRIILLDADKYQTNEEDAKKFNLRYRGDELGKDVSHIFFDSLMNNKYIKIPTENGFVKLNMHDNFIEKTMLNPKFDEAAKISFVIIAIHNTNPVVKEKLFMDILHTKTFFAKPDLMNSLKDIVKTKIIKLSTDLKYNLEIDKRHYCLKAELFKKNKFSMDNYPQDYKDFVIKAISHYIKEGGYYSRFKKIQYVIDDIVFGDFDRYKKQYIGIINNSSIDEYSINRTPLHHFASLSDTNLEWLYNTLKPEYTIVTRLWAEVLKRGIHNEHGMRLGRSDMYSVDTMFNELKGWPMDYEMAFIRMLSGFTGTSEFITNYKKIVKVMKNRETSSDFNMKYFEHNKDRILEFIDKDKQDEYSFEYINAHYTARVVNAGYNSVFSNDVDLLKHSKVGTREGDFSMMVALLFRSTSKDNHSDELVQTIIDKGVASLIGSSDSYSVRKRMVRTFASLVHEENRPDGFIETNDDHLKYFMESISNSKLRGTLLSKLFDMPVIMESEASRKRYMKKNSFFGKSYSGFMNVIDDVDYREDLNDIVLLLALS